MSYVNHVEYDVQKGLTIWNCSSYITWDDLAGFSFMFSLSSQFNISAVQK